MEKRHYKSVLWGLVVLVVLLSITLVEESAKKRRVQGYTQQALKIPPPDPSVGKPILFSIRENDWIYESARAKASEDIYGPYVDIETYLKRNIPIYRKKTYWGEEWDEEEEPIKPWDDNEDDEWEYEQRKKAKRWKE